MARATLRTVGKTQLDATGLAIKTTANPDDFGSQTRIPTKLGCLQKHHTFQSVTSNQKH